MFGKDYFRNREGKLIEVPSDMTASELAQLEADALATEKQLGKGPPPQPVPDVKKLDKKEDKKTQLKPPPKKKPGKGKRMGARGAAAASAMMKAAGTSKVAQYLASRAAPVVAKGFGKLQELRQNQQTHDSADEKRAQSEQAVLIPPSEGQSKSNAGQVNVVSERPAPKVDAGKGKQTLQQKLKENIPRKVEDVDNFKRDKKAQHTGAEVMKVVQVDKSAVVSTFQDMGHTPPPAPREFEPEPLPPPEPAPPTTALNLGKDGIAPLQKEHTDVSKYTKDADNKLKEEGVTQEQLDMVDSGDLAVANKEKKGMEKTAQTEPLAVQKFAQDQNKKVENDLKQEDAKKRGDMSARRKANLGVTGQKQKNTKTALEKKREEVAAKINGIYTAAQDKVKKRLADLEIESMKRFDSGNARATQQFEDDVNSELRAFKADRYSGWLGWARRVRDWWKGMDDLPAVKAIFERNRDKFVATINKLVEDITADNKKVIQECKDELQNARTQIKDYVDKLGPSLKDMGKKAADDMNSKLDQMDTFIAKKEEDLQNQLKDKQTAAIKAIDEKIEKMKEAMAGALAKLGKLLLWAAKKFFTWALEKFGFSLSEIEGIINKGVAVLKAIFTQPIRFVKNLMNAAITGFKNFGKNFLKHLKDALFEWLTGSLEGLQLPQTWDFKGIIGVALQMIGISYANIRRHMVAVMTEPVVAGLEKTFTLVRVLITEGPMAAWEQLKEMAGEMRLAFEAAIKDFIKQKIIEQAIQWIASLLIPGAGIIKAVIGIYDTVVFFIQKAKQIMKMISNFLGSIAEIAAGNIGAAAEAMEQGLARGLSLVINFLAALLRLSGITAKIREAIQKIRTKVDDVLLKVAKWIATKAKVLISKGVGAVKAGATAVFKWWKARKSFKVGKVPHELYMEGEQKAAKLMVQSTPQILENVIGTLRRGGPLTAAKKTAIDTIEFHAKKINKLKDEKGDSFGQEAGNEIMQSLTVIAANLSIAGLTPVPKSKVKFTPKTILGDPVAKQMEANPLTIDPGGLAGSAPHQETRLWKAVNQRANEYVRGHLLNHHVYGPGENRNLVPITRSANTTMEKQAEHVIKKAVIGNNQVVRFTVKTQGKQPARTHIPAESELPATIILSAVELEEDSGAWTKEGKALLKDHPIDNTLPADIALSVVRVDVNLSTARRAEIETIPGIGPVLADRIVKLRNKRGGAFHTYDDLAGADGIGAETVNMLRDDKWVTLF
ncbi:MAG TPA: helix-hairpin-helix domain-containing protein [Pyrinomonadaceae bacterium]|nr:helix-hairpin-helix domain-containing protein [Pyrinomonadaceae bacterium]